MQYSVISSIKGMNICFGDITHNGKSMRTAKADLILDVILCEVHQMYMYLYFPVK